MECNKDEAHRAKKIAEEKMAINDFEGARKIALKAKKLYPELENISQLIAVCDIHCAAEKKIYGAGKDLYGILQVDNKSDEITIRKQYRKLALVLHPDKNKFPGAESAFKLIGEANMTLSDQGKRSIYDIKCREPTKVSSTMVQSGQKSQTSYAGQQKSFKSQQSASNTSNLSTFWTHCPFCNIKYEYHKEFLQKALRCRHCSKLFIAYDIGPQMPAGVKAQSVNLGSKPVFQQKTENSKMKPEVVTKPKVNNVKKQTETVTAKSANKKTGSKMAAEGSETGFVKKETGSGSGVNGMNKKRGRKTAAEGGSTDFDEKQAAGGGVSGGVDGGANGMNKTRGRNTKDEGGSNGFVEMQATSDGGGVGGGVSESVDQRRSSRQKPQVSYQENGGGEFSPQKRSKTTKSSNDVDDVKREEVSECDDKSDVAPADVSTPNEKPKKKGKEGVKSDDDSDSDSEPVIVDCPDQDFTNFDKHKEEECFAVGQTWACYDYVDSMPRFYAQIRKIYSSKFKMRITWFESDPDNELESKWVDEELPVACGTYVLGENEETSDRLMFSHQITVKKLSSKSLYFVTPQKGEIWALFKDWDIKWSLEPEKHTKYKFDIVEIIEVDNDCITVGFLLKVKGFVSVFQRSIIAGVDEHKIPLNERFRFSHLIPSAKLTGSERVGVPVGSFELDMASLPADFEKYCSYYSNNVDMGSESKKEKVKPATNSVNTPKKHVNRVDKDTVKVRRSPRGLKSAKQEI